MIIGLTGTTGSGKTTAAQWMREAGWRIIDADAISHRLTAGKTPCVEEIARVFGKEVLFANGELNRAAMAQRVFSSDGERARLTAILHPAILDEIRREICRAQEEGERMVVIDAPLLFEAGLDRICDATVAVVASPEERGKRIMERDGLNVGAAENRMAAERKEPYPADYILENTGSLEEFKSKVLKLINRFLTREGILEQTD